MKTARIRRVLLFILICWFGNALHAQDTLYLINKAVPAEIRSGAALYPNIAGKAVMTPTAWGSAGTYAFGFAGGTFPQIYSTSSDMLLGAGIGFGNATKAVSAIAILNLNDVSQFKTVTGSFILSRHITGGSSISAGALHLFGGKLTDAGPSVYMAFSHASQKLATNKSGYSRLSYTIGAGTGRFYDKTDIDAMRNKGEHGTAVFANISYGILKNLNINAEWTGLNAGISFGWRPAIAINFPFRLPAIGIGVTDLLRTSGERTRLLLSLSHSFLIAK